MCGSGTARSTHLYQAKSEPSKSSWARAPQPAPHLPEQLRSRGEADHAPVLGTLAAGEPVRILGRRQIVRQACEIVQRSVGEAVPLTQQQLCLRIPEKGTEFAQPLDAVELMHWCDQVKPDEGDCAIALVPLASAVLINSVRAILRDRISRAIMSIP